MLSIELKCKKSNTILSVGLFLLFIGFIHIYFYYVHWHIERKDSAYYEYRSNRKELWVMGRRRSIMSQQLKEEIAKELGFYDVVQREGWGGIRSRDAGNMVKRAIEMAEEQLAQRSKT